MALLQQKQSKLIEEERKVRGAYLALMCVAGGSIEAGGGV